MSLKIQYDQTLRTAAKCGTDTSSASMLFADTNDPLYGTFGNVSIDPGIILKSRIFNDATRNLRALLGLVRLPTSSDVVYVQGDKPLNTEYNLRNDIRRFGSIFNFLTIGLLGNLTEQVVLSGDKDVVHSTYSGLARYAPQIARRNAFIHSGSQAGPFSLWFPSFTGTQGASSILWGEPITAVEDHEIANHCFLEDALAIIAEQTDGVWQQTDVIWTFNYLRRCYIQNLEYRFTDFDTLEITFDWAQRRWDDNKTVYDGEWWQRESHVWLRLQDTTTYDGSMPEYDQGEVYSLLGPELVITCSYTPHTITEGTSYNHCPSWWYDTLGETYGTTTVVVDPVLTSDILDFPGWSEKPSLHPNSWRPGPTHVSVGPGVDIGSYDTRVHCYFTRRVKADRQNLLPSLFYSEADALNTWIKVLKTNHIETLYELAAIGSMLPNLGPIVHLLNDIKSLRLLDAGERLLDIITSNNLMYRFGWAPTVSSIQELDQGFHELRSRLDGSADFGPKTLYGQFIYELPEGNYGFDQPILISRTKARVRFDSSSLLTMILGAQAVGLAPTLSAIWDLVPFSFVVDWFLNIGQRLEDIETQGMMLIIPHMYSCHSITVVDGFPLELLEDLNLETIGTGSSGSNVPALVYYERRVSGIFPPLRESYYDFRAATNPVDVGLAGSLAWQVL